MDGYNSFHTIQYFASLIVQYLKYVGIKYIEYINIILLA